MKNMKSKTLILSTLLAISCHAEPKTASCKCDALLCEHLILALNSLKDRPANRLQFKFESFLTTNKYSEWEWSRRGQREIWFTNGLSGYSQLNYNHTCPTYPQTNTYVDYYEVVSNTVALLVLDGQTNRIAVATNAIDSYKQTVRVVVSTITNTSTTTEHDSK